MQMDVKLLNTVHPRVSPLGAYLFLIFLGWGLSERRVYSRGGLTKLSEISHIKSQFQYSYFII